MRHTSFINVLVSKMIRILLLIFALNIGDQNVLAQSIQIQNVSRNIYDNIYVYYFPGPTVETKIKYKLKDGLEVTNLPEFDKNRPTIFYLHGYNSGAEKQANNSLIQALLIKGDYNVLFFDYSGLVDAEMNIFIFLSYVDAVRNSYNIGKAIGQFLEYYIPNKQPKEMVHLISHSIGSQVMSRAARTFGTGQLWLTALDPAGPLFNLPFFNNLNASDGCFVDVVHTNDGQYGDERKVGDVDFFVNGGRHQPGCPTIILDLIMACSHERSWEYYAESVLNERSLPAKKCKPPISSNEDENNCDNSDVIYMGLTVNKRAEGSFYLRTRPRKPFGMGKAGYY